MITIKKGTIILYRVFDVAWEIDLSKIERKMKEGAKRMKLSKVPYSKALEISNPPVTFEMTGFTRHIFGKESQVTVLAKAYDFGVVSLSFSIPCPEGSTFDDLESESMALENDETMDEKANEYVKDFIESMGDTIVKPGTTKEFFMQDYMVFYMETLSPSMNASEVLDRYDFSRLLLYEKRNVSRELREEATVNRFSYYPDDMVILHHGNAFILDPSGSQDIVEILEFSCAQILEMRYYDYVLDGELNRFYAELSGTKSKSSLGIRHYEKLAKRITETVTDLTEILEKVNNALKVTEDIYYARIYRRAMTLFRSKDWETSIKEKLSTITENYKILYEEIATKRGHILELWIIILIIIEILLFF